MGQCRNEPSTLVVISAVRRPVVEIFSQEFYILYLEGYYTRKISNISPLGPEIFT